MFFIKFMLTNNSCLIYNDNNLSWLTEKTMYYLIYALCSIPVAPT